MKKILFVEIDMFFNGKNRSKDPPFFVRIRASIVCDMVSKDSKFEIFIMEKTIMKGNFILEI